MSIRSKAIALILTTMLVFLTSLFLVAEYVLMERFQTLESREAQNNIERVRNAAHLEFDFLKAKAADWIAWDDAYTFVQDGNPEFRAANLFDQNGANMKVNFLIYFNQDGEVMGSFGWDLEKAQPLPIPAEIMRFLQPGVHFLEHESADDIKSGFVSFPQQSLKDLQSRLLGPKDLQDASAVTNACLEATLQEEAGKTFAFLRDSALELAMRLNKKVHVVIHGEDVRLPLQYADVLHGLLHLIRNALDHGLESSSERHGKSPIRTLSIEAQENLEDLTIIIRDDGRGIDISEVQLEIVMLNGFSTRREVTALSGRGIGLDVVASSLKKYGGSMHIMNRPGWGTTITIRLSRHTTPHLTQAA